MYIKRWTRHLNAAFCQAYFLEWSRKALHNVPSCDWSSVQLPMILLSLWRILIIVQFWSCLVECSLWLSYGEMVQQAMLKTMCKRLLTKLRKFTTKKHTANSAARFVVPNVNGLLISVFQSLLVLILKSSNTDYLHATMSCFNCF